MAGVVYVVNTFTDVYIVVGITHNAAVVDLGSVENCVVDNFTGGRALADVPVCIVLAAAAYDAAEVIGVVAQGYVAVE